MPTQPLTTRFIAIDVVLQTPGSTLRDQIEAQLQTVGQPLRWAITSVANGLAHVEAVVPLPGEMQR